MSKLAVGVRVRVVKAPEGEHSCAYISSIGQTGVIHRHIFKDVWGVKLDSGMYEFDTVKDHELVVLSFQKEFSF